MFESLPHMVNLQLRWLFTGATRGAQAIWDWYRELGHENDSEARGLRLLREWLSPEQLAQFIRDDSALWERIVRQAAIEPE